MATLEETLKKLGLATARGIPQLATGFVDLAALPFTITGMLKPEQAVGSTAYLTSKGLLPPEQKGLLGETTELVSSALNPAAIVKSGLIGIGGTFIGKNAKNWSQIAENKFLELEKAGVPPEQIWQQTGTLRGFDGKLKQEISDKDAQAFFTHLQESGTTQLAPKALVNPAVEAAYPQFSNISQYGLREKLPGGSFEGMYTDGQFKGGLLMAKGPNVEGLKSAGLHEMQHGVQAIEGFSTGTSPSGIGKGEISSVVTKRVQKLRNEAMDLLDKDKLAESKLKDSQANKLIEEARMRAYLRNAGEAEARLTQRRMNLTDSERLANYPYSRGEYGLDVNPRKIRK
jgi:hypothetical protein